MKTIINQYERFVLLLFTFYSTIDSRLKSVSNGTHALAKTRTENRKQFRFCETLRNARDALMERNIASQNGIQRPTSSSSCSILRSRNEIRINRDSDSDSNNIIFPVYQCEMKCNFFILECKDEREADEHEIFFVLYCNLELFYFEIRNRMKNVFFMWKQTKLVEFVSLYEWGQSNLLLFVQNKQNHLVGAFTSQEARLINYI